MDRKPIPYGRQNIDQKDIEAVTEVLKADFLTQGPKVKEFEEKFANYVDAKYAVAVNNATAGLHISVQALGLKKYQRVITTPITFAASANCVRYCDGEVWFSDIDRETYLLSIESTRRLIQSKPKGYFSGIIAVDFAGLPIDTEQFKKLCEEHNLWLLEDACHAPGAYYIDGKNEKQKVGSSKYSDISVFSFHPVKHIACGEGGMITTNSKDIYDRLIKLRTHGITKEGMIQNPGGWYYEMQELGYNYRLTDIQSALGITQLNKNKEGVVRRNEIASVYKKAFEGKFTYQTYSSTFYNAYHLFIIEVENRKELYEKLREEQIFAQIHYIPVHKLPYYEAIGYNSAELNNAEDYYSKCISLPMYPTLTDEEQLFVIEKVFEHAKIK